MNMTKKILPAMIGAALVGGMTNAVADVTAMGHIDTAILYQDAGAGATPDETDSTTNLVCTTCSFGFKGSEDLGNGLKAIFLIDFEYDTTERNKTITDRDQWLGLDSNFGKLRMGTISTGYKSHGAMIDPIYRTVVQGRGIGLQSNLHNGAGDDGYEGRSTNTFRYDSPTFAGFSATAHYVLQNDTATNDTNSPWGIGGQWQGGAFLVFADYITSDAGGDDDAWAIGGRFGYDKFAIFGQYEGDMGLISSSGNAVTNWYAAGLPEGLGGSLQECPKGVDAAGNNCKAKGDGADTWFVGGTATFGNNMIYAAYGQQSDSSDTIYDDNGIDTGYDSWNIVGVHSMSKRTKLYAGYAQLGPNENDLDNIDWWTLGMKHTF
jgi:predicted porin